MDPFRRYIITQIIKQTGKIPRADTVLSNAVAQLKIRLNILRYMLFLLKIGKDQKKKLIFYLIY